MAQIFRPFASIAAACVLSACSTVKMPNADFLRLPEFREAAAKLIEGYPDVSAAPSRPDDYRTAEEWDAAARELLQKQAALRAPKDGTPALTEAELDAQLARLKAEIRRYKLDDPQ